VGWLARYNAKDFGKKKILEILTAANIPSCVTTNQQGKKAVVYSLKAALEAIYAYRRALNGIKPKKGDAAKELASKLPQDEITPEERKEQAAKLAEAAAK
jgi:hypothetical protein